MIVLFLLLAFLIAIFICHLLETNNDTKTLKWVRLVLFTSVIFYVIWRAFLDVT